MEEIIELKKQLRDIEDVINEQQLVKSLNDLEKKLSKQIITPYQAKNFISKLSNQYNIKLNKIHIYINISSNLGKSNADLKYVFKLEDKIDLSLFGYTFNSYLTEKSLIDYCANLEYAVKTVQKYEAIKEFLPKENQIKLQKFIEQSNKFKEIKKLKGIENSFKQKLLQSNLPSKFTKTYFDKIYKLLEPDTKDLNENALYINNFIKVLQDSYKNIPKSYIQKLQNDLSRKLQNISLNLKENMEFLFKILNDNEVLLELYKECIMKRSYYLQDMYCLLYLYQNNEYKNEIKQSIMYRIKKELTKVYLNDNLISQEQIQQIYEQNLNEYISRTGFKINI